jgi:spore coat polysaccharide biosynthesis protein SpsF
MTIGAFITARLKSERLPRKALKPLGGRPMIAHLVDRLRRVEGVDRIVLCTSWLPEDEPLARFAQAEGIGVYRGEPVDVLARLAAAARSFGVEQVLSCTADNPLTDPRAMGDLLRFHLREGLDYSRSKGLPLGAFGYAVSAAALQRVCAIKQGTDTEIWGGYFTAPEAGFRWGTLAFDEVGRNWPELRVTVDTPEDFRFVERVFESLHRPGEVFGIEEVVALCRREPHRLRVNRGIRQKIGPPPAWRGTA